MKCNPERLEIATKYAKQKGFQGAAYLLDWFDYSVFTPLFRDNVVHYIGKPIFILVNDTESPRIAMECEWQNFYI